MNEEDFRKLTGHLPFPWQRSLYQKFAENNPVRAVCVPTGLGKTNVIAIWLLALMDHPGRMPRRLVYIVNRRTVVDQTTAEAERLRENLPKLARPGFKSLAISTLRGQFADNREWSADPSRPAVICGTVDMIGSRLLFSGYRTGFKAAPLHAGFLGQDALLVHDEAHLEPAFQTLLTAIEAEQKRCKEFAGFRVIELTATTRGGTLPEAEPLRLTDEDMAVEIVQKRVGAHKHLNLKRADDDKNIAQEIAELAFRHNNAGAAVLVFVQRLADVSKVCNALTKLGADHIQKLTGTMRGKERDRLVKSDPLFARFMPPSDRPEDVPPAEGTVYLVSTSAGEVGINISADHMVCDLSTFESMVQRFGRVNRYGDRHDTQIDVVYPSQFDEKREIDIPRKKTLELLKKLNGNASPKALMALDPKECNDAFSPEPVILPATDILFDAWAMTSIRARMPGRPPVEPYLHGISESEPPRTSVAWRQEVEIINTDELLERNPPETLLDDYPLKPHELLTDNRDRVYDELKKAAKRAGTDHRVWIVRDRGEVEVLPLNKLLDADKNKVLNDIAGCTILLPPSLGGLNDGMLDGASQCACDVADLPDDMTERRIRVMSDDPEYKREINGMRLVRSIELDSGEEETDAQPRTWDWFKLKPVEDVRTARQPVLLDTHAKDVQERADQILKGLSLDEDIAQAVRVAARLHDHGKKRQQFQATLGNSDPNRVLAKSGRAAARFRETFRHEFGSLIDAAEDAEFQKLPPEMQDLALHLIAAHHGRARPHFDPDEAHDSDHPQHDSDREACEIPRRFARLQRRYGRWGLAYLESLLRAADWAASAEPSEFETEEVTQ